jgi:uncharacterized protein (DUF1330 family)
MPDTTADSTSSPTMPIGLDITPDQHQNDAFRQRLESGDDEPVILLNLIGFDSAEGQATYSSGYGAPVLQLLADVGAKQIFGGKVNGCLIGDEEANRWNQLWLTWYPSRDAVGRMVENPAYGQAHQSREAGLSRTLVLDVTEIFRDLS